MTDNQIIYGDSLEILRTLPDNSVDAIVSDPPAGIGFMQSSTRTWDSDKGGRDQWVAWLSSIMTEAYRVLKPGGHGLIWALPRTSHWTALALEDAGFEIRDCCYHLFGSGFPKSLDVSKAIDKHLGAEREVIGKSNRHVSGKPNQKTAGLNGSKTFSESIGMGMYITAPATPEAQQYAGYGTALKPAVEVWWLIRKPLSEKSIAANVLRWGTGGLNIDGCRIGTDENDLNKMDRHKNPTRTGWIANSAMQDSTYAPNNLGRFPSHLLLSHSLFCTPEQCAPECPVRVMDEQSGVRKNGGPNYSGGNRQSMFGNTKVVNPTQYAGDSGGASRYFAQFYYTSKASRAERNAGCEELPERLNHSTSTHGNGNGKTRMANQNERANGITSVEMKNTYNNHPTVKPLSLMSYLVRMITPPDGIVLDPFAGSGTTGVACIQENKRFILIEREQEYIDIIRARIAHAYKQREASIV